MHKLPALVFAILFAVIISACGGGGDTSSSTEKNVDIVVRGTAAAGAPIDGYVSLFDSSGNRQPVQENIPIDANGNFSIHLNGFTPPYVFSATGTAKGNPVSLYSAATQAIDGGTVNITPFTDIIVRAVARVPIDEYLAGGKLLSLSSQGLEAQRISLTSSFAQALTAMGLPQDIDLLHAEFKADGIGFDRFMDAVKVVPTSATSFTVKNILDPSIRLVIDTAAGSSSGVLGTRGLSNFSTRSGAVIQNIAAGEDHTLVLKTDGTVFAWGNNHRFQVGQESEDRVFSPSIVKGINDVIAIAAGRAHSMALKSDGTVWAWGNNAYGELGIGKITGSLPFAIDTPTQVIGLSGITAIAAGSGHSVALKDDGTVWIWGWGLDDGGSTSRAMPIQVDGIRDAVKIAAGGGSALALLRDGSVWAWGLNRHGELGDGTTKDAVLPVRVSGLAAAGAITAIAKGDSTSFAIGDDGYIWAWGRGPLGIGSYMDISSKAPMRLGLKDVTEIAAGLGHHICIKKDGTAWIWGWNAEGQLGDGTIQFESTPFQVLGLSDVTAVAVGDIHTIALTGDGILWAWGWNGSGQLGNGGYSSSHVPSRVTGLQ